MTKYFKREEMNSFNISEVAHAIKEGKLVVFPTDTVYGIGTNAYDEDACKRVYKVKERPEYKPLCILISDICMLKDLVESISPVEQKLIDVFWPGPLTIIFRKKGGSLPNVVTAGNEYVGLRLIDSGIVHELIETSGVPIVAPSANLSDSLTGTKIDNIIKELGDKVDYILDYGDMESDTVSTIVQVKDEEVIIIREGKIKKEELLKVVPLIN